MTAMRSEPLDLSPLGLLDADTRVFPKDVRPGPPVVLPDAVLKWYGMAEAGTDLATLEHAARAFLAAESAAGSLVLENGLGFVELHHCSTVAFLIVMTWRHNNELWQTSYLADLTATEPVFVRVTETAHGHRPMLCIWELVPVWHERGAWIRYIGSARDDAARRAWLEEVYTGTC
ncbi:MAG: hypothetical protein WBA46_18480 [Thermomicrobiales bacterium]